MPRLIILFFAVISFTGCATIFKGYESHVELYLVPDSLRVFTLHGEEVPIHEMEFTSKNVVSISKVIYLRSNQIHVLRLQKGDKQKIVSLYPKLSAGWLLLDIVSGGFPLFIDMYTGAWFHFDDVNAFLE
jgi:hypothetical protein